MALRALSNGGASNPASTRTAKTTGSGTSSMMSSEIAAARPTSERTMTVRRGNRSASELRNGPPISQVR